MKKQSPLIILLLLVLSLSFILIPANAQGPTDLSELTIKLWPEYDNPGLLVIIDGQLATPGSEIRLPIPSQAKLNAVATANDSGRLLKNEWTEEQNENGQRVLVMVPQNPIFRVEYYTPFPVDGDKRDIHFELPAGYLNAESASIEVLLPPGSEDIQLTPPADESGPTQDQAHIFQRNLGAVKDQAIVQQVVYANPSGELTIPETSTSSGAPLATQTPSQEQTKPQKTETSSFPWIIVLGVLALVLIVGGAIGLWLTRDRDEEALDTPPPARSAKKKKSGSISVKSSRGNLDRFCRQCGKEFGPDDRFCRYCGAPRRSI